MVTFGGKSMSFGVLSATVTCRVLGSPSEWFFLCFHMHFWGLDDFFRVLSYFGFS